ncbi:MULTISPECIES: hypothetical protein [unclassified Streptomyces]|uniref:hypothetical protein n=1 Tax=unclassified Streptomyces TaxID=2593676 RepID=UPI003D72BE78
MLLLGGLFAVGLLSGGQAQAAEEAAPDPETGVQAAEAAVPGRDVVRAAADRPASLPARTPVHAPARASSREPMHASAVGAAWAVTPHHQELRRLAAVDVARADVFESRDRYRDIPVFPA